MSEAVTLACDGQEDGPGGAERAVARGARGCGARAGAGGGGRREGSEQTAQGNARIRTG